MNEEGQKTVNEKIKLYFEEINSHDFSIKRTGIMSINN